MKYFNLACAFIMCLSISACGFGQPSFSEPVDEQLLCSLSDETGSQIFEGTCTLQKWWKMIRVRDGSGMDVGNIFDLFVTEISDDEWDAEGKIHGEEVEIMNWRKIDDNFVWADGTEALLFDIKEK